MIIRCEVTLDLGKTWRLATIARKEEPTVYGKYWCWVRWSLSVPTVDILRAPELRCRAVDSSNNSQPEGCACKILRNVGKSVLCGIGSAFGGQQLQQHLPASKLSVNT